MKKLFIVLIVIAFMATPALAGSYPLKDKKDSKVPTYTQYEEGFNDALDALVLLSMELNMRGERMTWKQMMNVCRERFNIQTQDFMA